MSQRTDIVALVFDFDDTLVPDSTTKLLREHSIDPEKFWGTDVKALIALGYDPPTAYLKLLFDNVGAGKPLGELTNSKLRDFGKSLDQDFYPGLPSFFDEVRESVKSFKDIKVEYYIISGGLQAMIEGSTVVQKHFDGVYGCQLTGDTADGQLKYIQRSITFTEKTRYLFEISKGVDPSESRSNPYAVNKYLDEKDRRVPLRNMIYVGDGLTDIPCFSLLQKNKGLAFGVFDPSDMGKAKRALEEFLIPKRVTSMHAPKYSEESELGIFLRSAVLARCSEIQLSRRTAI